MAAQKAADTAAELAKEGLKQWGDSSRRQDLEVRGPIDKRAQAMTKYIIIAVVIIAIIMLYFAFSRKWVEPPKYQSVFDSFTTFRIPENKPQEKVSDATRIFGIMPRASLH